MKTFLYTILVFFIFACSSSKWGSNRTNPLNGTWIPVKQEMGGKNLPISFFEKQKLSITDSNYTLLAESEDKGVLSFNQNKMDIYGKEGVNVGKHFTAIYKLENGFLTICYNLKGEVYPTDFETNGSPFYFLSVFKKEMKK
jgi:uncharacterized protein (TIGR03067 family)